jgi:hypothetical protein
LADVDGTRAEPNELLHLVGPDLPATRSVGRMWMRFFDAFGSGTETKSMRARNPSPCDTVD